MIRNSRANLRISRANLRISRAMIRILRARIRISHARIRISRARIRISRARIRILRARIGCLGWLHWDFTVRRMRYLFRAIRDGRFDTSQDLKFGLLMTAEPGCSESLLRLNISAELNLIGNPAAEDNWVPAFSGTTDKTARACMRFMTDASHSTLRFWWRG